MSNFTAANIYHSILLRAADEWGVKYEDVERDIGQHFDPVVRFLAGACASELEAVYRRVDDTEYRLQQRLARTLLPDFYHVPTPAHSLATATPDESHVLIDETTQFYCEIDDDETKVFFSPLFSSNLLGLELKIIATPEEIVGSKKRNVLSKGQIESKRVNWLTLGFSMISEEEEQDWREASLFFDLKGKSNKRTERTKFFGSLTNCRVFAGGKPLSTINGLPQSTFALEDYLNGNERLVSRIRARYERHFITFTQEKVGIPEKIEPSKFLKAWFTRFGRTDETVKAQIEKIDDKLADEPLVWLELKFDQPLEIEDPGTRLVVRPNVFPVVNRKLEGAGTGSHHYINNNSIQWLHVQPDDPFLSIRKVYQEKPPENPEFIFKPFSEFKEGRDPSYTLRLGGVGRWDEHNVWGRLSYIVSILQENYHHQELLENAASGLSLEELHHLLGNRISESESAEHAGVKDIYVLLHTGLTSGMRVRVEYWTSLGDEANGIAAKTSLKCIGKMSSDFLSETLELVSTSEGGDKPFNNTEQLFAMKGALLSRGRIVTKEDVRVYCKELLRARVDDIIVGEGVGSDPRTHFGLTRRLEVKLIPSQESQEEDWEAICSELMYGLEQKSASTIPIHVFAEIANNK